LLTAGGVKNSPLAATDNNELFEEFDHQQQPATTKENHHIEIQHTISPLSTTTIGKSSTSKPKTHYATTARLFFFSG